MIDAHPPANMPERRRDEPVDEDVVDEIVDEIRHGKGLGGKHLGELGTTGGTQVGAEVQAVDTDVPPSTGTVGHAYEPGMAGRTARGADLRDAPADQPETDQPKRAR